MALETAVDNITLNILNEVDERTDRFIFKTILAWSYGESHISNIVISKDILVRALTCFQSEHPEEYAELLKKME